MTDEVTIGDLAPVVSLLPAALIEIEQGTASFSATIQQVIDLVPAIKSINADTTGAQIIAAGTGLGIVDAGATHTLSIDATVATLTGAQVLTNKTLTTPTIASFVNATHDHSNAAGGGQLTNTALVSGVFGAITGLGVQSQTLDMGNNQITLGSGIFQFNDVNTTIVQSGADLQYDVNAGGIHRFRVSNFTQFQLSSTALTLAAGNNLVIQGTAGTGYIDIGEITTPSNPAANVGRLYVKDVAAVTTLFFRDSAGAETDLLAGGGGNTFARVVKKVDETVNNSTTMQDDDELKFTPNINKTYHLELRIFYRSNSTPDYKYGLSLPSGATALKNTDNFNTDGTATESFAPRSATAVGTDRLICITARVIMGSTAGEIAFQFAQNVAEVSDTKTLQGSSLTVWEETA